MSPPRANLDGSLAGKASHAAVSLRLDTLKKRADFLRAARGSRVVTPSFVLQARTRQPAEADGMRVGFTCSKKVGNAVARNRAKRRLRAVARGVLPVSGREDTDYVLIGRAVATASRPFEQMVKDLETALAKLHKDRS
jgi:ribonuclease P protein component